jgi:diguanylate cyclase (GGDEF)-like protein
MTQRSSSVVDATGRLGTSGLHLVFGILFGSSFVVLGVAISLAGRGLPLEAAFDGRAFAADPLLWIIGSSPLVQGLSFWLVGRSRASLERELVHRRVAEAEMRHRAFHDELTGLSNRAHLFSRLDGGEVRDGTLLLFDLDKFKRVNDTLGHAVGDELLRAVAGALTRAFAARGWLVHRLGGDEFAVVVPPGETGVEAAARVSRLFGKPLAVGEAEIRVGVSVGVCRIVAEISAHELLRRADVALYVAKTRPGNSWDVFDAAMDEAMRGRASLEDDLSKAVEARELELHYQPIHEIASGRIVACEALVRWRSPKRGLVPPADFIDVAEETGSVVEIGRWILEEACRTAARWPEPVGVAVNVSPAQFRDRRFFTDLERACREGGLDPRRLTIEITENLLIDDLDEVVRMLVRIRGLGVGVSFDDFGTGYCNFGLLNRLPVDRIKIDGSFVRRMLADRAEAEVIEAIVRLGHGLGKRVLVEGVERPEQLAFVRALGVDEVQGFLFARAVPSAELDFAAVGEAPGAGA